MGNKEDKKGHFSKSGRWIVPKAKKPAGQDPPPPPPPEEKPPEGDHGIQDTLSQIDLDIPGMVVLTSKEDRHLGRLNQDIKAKEEFTSTFSKADAGGAPGAIPAQQGGSAAPAGMVSEGDRILLDILAERELITPEQRASVESAAIERGVTVVEIIIDDEMMPGYEVGAVIAGEYKVPFSKLEELRILKNALGVIAMEEIQTYQVIPLSKIGKTLNIAAVNPIQNPMIEKLKKESGFDVKTIVCTPATLYNTLRKYYG